MMDDWSCQLPIMAMLIFMNWIWKTINYPFSCRHLKTKLMCFSTPVAFCMPVIKRGNMIFTFLKNWNHILLGLPIPHTVHINLSFLMEIIISEDILARDLFLTVCFLQLKTHYQKKVNRLNT